MHRKQILRALIVGFFMLGSASPSFAAKGVKVDVFADFQKKLDKLEGEIGKEKDITKRYDLFLKTYREISDLRAKNPRQAEAKELDMSLYMDSLAFLPEKKDFQVKKCSEYKNEVQSLMKSYDKTQKEPFVERAVRLVELICKGS